MDQAYEEIAQQVRQVPASVGHTKRLAERYGAEPDFAAGINLSPESLPIRFGEQLIGADEISAYERHRENRRRLGIETFRLCAPQHPRIRAFRARQIRRARWELGAGVDEDLLHVPLSFELSRGCTVGCWFCAVSALPYGGSLPYNEQTAGEWRALLTVLQEFFGPATAHGFLYWATDPLDNPDYERFLIDFHAVTGSWPQTTTALALRDVERTRRLLELGAAHGRTADRFSVLSRSAFRRILDEFSPEELLHVDLIPQFNEEASPKSLSGRARERSLRKQAKTPDVLNESAESTPPPAGTTSSCVTGFLFNLVERTAKLISPCPASARWPLGYLVFDEFTYTDAADLRDKIEQSIATRMPIVVSTEMKMGFSPCWRVEYPTDGTFVLRSPHWNVSFNRIRDGEDLARRIEKGIHTAGEIATARMVERQIDPVQTFRELNLLFQQGVLGEETLPEKEVLVPLPRRRQSSANVARP